MIFRFWLHKFKWHIFFNQTEYYLNKPPKKYQWIILLDAVDGMIHLYRDRSWLFNKMFTGRISLYTIECIFKLKSKTNILRTFMYQPFKSMKCLQLIKYLVYWNQRKNVGLINNIAVDRLHQSSMCYLRLYAHPSVYISFK